MKTTEQLMVEADGLIQKNPDGLVGEDRDRVEAIAAEIRQLKEADEKRAADARLADLEKRFAAGDVTIESGTSFENVNYTANRDPFETPGRRETPSEIRSRAVSGIERWNADDSLKEAASKTVERTSDNGVAEHVLLTSSPAYSSAFHKMLKDPQGFRDILTDSERGAWADVRDLQHRAALDLSGAVLPSPLDPAIVLSNSGVIDPMRSVARVDQTTANTKRYITSSGVISSFDDELVEVSDDSPTLTEVTITTRKAQGFVQASIEAAMDQPDYSEEVARLLGDAKARLEGINFITGTAAQFEPIGLEGKLDGGASEVDPATAEVFAAADVYTMLETLPPRHRPNATWMAELSTLNAIDQMETGNGAKLFPDVGGANPRLLRRPVVENSNVDAHSDIDVAATADNFILFVGDFKNYVILDRVGMVISMVPHLFNTSNNLPDGRTGAYATWRVGADALHIDAFRLLDILTAA